MLILGIESSCDETSVALVEDGTRVVRNLITSQVRLHAKFGGVVPELASRAHIQRLVPMIEECLKSAQNGFDSVDAIAVTRGPGLVGALLVGVETAKALAFATHKPLIPVNHIAAHLYSPMLDSVNGSHSVLVIDPAGVRSEESHTAHPGGEAHVLDYPYVGLVVSGGHSSLVRVDSPGCFVLLGETVDDAAGEAFDKLAKLLELGYPGGPIVDRLAGGGDSRRFTLPRPMLNQPNYDFSFSGLKTAALAVVRELGVERIRSDEQLTADLCASFQEAVVEVLLRKAARAIEESGARELAVVGGVACNSRLRSGVADYLPGVRAVFPLPVLCTDNAAMIAGLAYHFRDSAFGADLTLNAQADLTLA